MINRILTAILRFGIALNQAAIDAVKGWIR